MPFQFGQSAFSAKAQQSALDATTQKYNALTIATQRASRQTTSFADATGRGTITLENFGRTFSNATRKVLIWQFAIMAVYGVIRKVGETIQTWKDLEVTLARISITTGALGTRLQQYFRQVADVAISFGMPIEQTLTGMDLALRATARYSEQADRNAIAVNLLSSASALANITGMQYSQAIDILVGSLRQSDMELNEGITLLDKWVAVAKNAAVSVNDLSQGFAIMADAGRAAGMTVDQINGLIAALSETVTLGPVQIGNAIRALMSTLYNPGSIALLQKYGVAVRDTSGEVRSFWEVMTQLSSMRLAGVLDEAVWLEIAKAAGAGQRRYAQFLALLNNFTTAMRVSRISTVAEGEAMDANRLIVETLTNTWDKFTAAQRKFLLQMGTQTGAIEDMTSAIQGLANFFNKLSSASDGVYKLGRAVMFLVGTLAALKIATLAMGWMGVGPKVGAVMGRFAGVPPTAVAGSAAYAKAIQAGGFTTAQQAAGAGLGTVAPGLSSQAGMYALSGLLPMMMFRRMWGGGPAPTIPGAENVWRAGGGQYVGGKWQAGGGRWTAPTVAPMTWGGVGRGAGRWLTQPMGGMGRAVGGLAMGAAAYGLTGEWQSAAGAGIGAGIGAALGGPVGMMAGAALGGMAGHVLADTFISEETRLKGLFSSIAEQFSIDLSGAIEQMFGKPVDKFTLEEARRAAVLAAPTYPIEELAKNQSILLRVGATLGFGEAVPYLTNIGELAEDWKEGTGALYELYKARELNLIGEKRFQEVVEETAEIGQFAWHLLNDTQKALLFTMRERISAHGEELTALDYIVESIKNQITTRRELAEVTNRYSESQTRIKQLMLESGAVISDISLKEWEQAKVQGLLADQVNKTAEDFQAWYNVLLGSAYGYASHVEAIQQLKPLLEEYGLAIDKIPEEKWLLIQRWDPKLATDIVQTIGTLLEMSDAIDKFQITFPDMLRLANVDGTIADIDRVKEALLKLHEETGDEKYAAALEQIDNYLGQVMQKEIESRRITTYAGRGAEFQRPTQVRLVDAETIKAYRENLGRLPVFTDLAKGLGKTADSVLTLVDPLTGDMLRLQENTLALEMLGRAVSDNTTAQEKRLEAEYNLPSDYARPSRYWYYRTTGSTEFGPQQESLWGMWEDFVKTRSKQGGGDITQTGAYFLHKGESVLNSDILATTNNILIGSHQVLVNSQNYLSQINMGIISLREEVASLRNRLGKVGVSSKGAEFSRVAGAGQGGDIPTFGARGLLD